MLSCLVIWVVTPLQGRDRGKARLAYKEAVQYHEEVLRTPPEERSLDQYNRSIYLYRLVLDHDPTYGACDDALYAIATLYEEIFRSSGAEDARSNAEYYYRFLAREYPGTKFREDALSGAASLESQALSLNEEHAGNPTLPATITEIRYWSTAESTRVVIQLDREAEFSRQVLHAPDRIYFDIADARLQSGLEKVYDVNGVSLERIRVAEHPEKTIRVVLDFRRIHRHSVFSLYHPFRIVVDARSGSRTREDVAPPETLKSAEAVIQMDQGPTSRQVLTERPAGPALDNRPSLTRVLGLKIHRIALDPGHGGRDTGTRGPRGILEKELALDISLRLKALLEEGLGIEVILTRDTDEYVPLEERTAIAANRGADLFVSIHANSSKVRSVAGSETFYLSFDSSTEELEIASRENATAQRTVSELEELLHRIVLDDFSSESKALARRIQATLFSTLQRWRPDWKDRGVKKAPFIVLLNSGMPSILVEVGFLSNPGDEELLSSDKGRQRTAEALYEGLNSYLEAAARHNDVAESPGPPSR